MTKTSRQTKRRLLAAFLSLGLLTSPAAALDSLSIKKGNWAEGSIALMLKGDIGTGDALLVQRALRDNKGSLVVVVLDSPGGSLAESLRIGRMLRDEKAATFVPSWGTCTSACFYIFAGGESRFVGEGARIGVHQFAYNDSVVENANTTMKNAQTLTSEINLFLARSGVDPLVGVLAGAVPPTEMLVFDYEDLKSLGIVTAYSEDSGEWASEQAVQLSSGDPVTRFTKDPNRVDWCGVPVFSADGTFKQDAEACTQ